MFQYVELWNVVHTGMLCMQEFRACVRGIVDNDYNADSACVCLVMESMRFNDFNECV